MNLEHLFELQAKLDERIYKEHPPTVGEDRLAKKILALQVELGELANEWRGFKYWSKDQKPRIWELKEWKDNMGESHVNTINPLLEEYVDGLHFLLSIGNEIEYNQDFTIGNAPKEDSLVNMFKNVFRQAAAFDSCISDLKYRFKDSHNFNAHRVHYSILLDLYLELGEMLGFTWEQIEKAYMEKNAVNHERQNNSY